MPRVRLPFCYEASFKKKGRKTVHKGYLSGEVSGDVPELCDGDVRVVAEWENLLFPDDGRLNRTRFAASRAVIWNGGLYVPAGVYMENTVPADVIAKTLDVPQDEAWHYRAIYGFDFPGDFPTEIGDCVRGCGGLEFHGIENPFKRKPKPKFEPSDTIVDAMGAETHRDIVQNIVNSLIFIEGKVWKRVPSIQLQLNLNQGAKSAWITVVHGLFGYKNEPRLPDKHTTVRALRHRYYALTEIGRLLEDIGPGIDVSWQVFNLVIHDAEAIRFNGATEYTVRAMEHCLLLHEDSLGSMSRELVDDWTALRAAVDRHKERPIYDVLQDDVDRLFRLLDEQQNPDAWSVRINEEIKAYVTAYRSTKWDGGTPMPTIGHHDSSRWHSARR